MIAQRNHEHDSGGSTGADELQPYHASVTVVPGANASLLALQQLIEQFAGTTAVGEIRQPIAAGSRACIQVQCADAAAVARLLRAVIETGAAQRPNTPTWKDGRLR